MLLLISNKNDNAVNDIACWMLHYQIPFIRINQEDPLDSFSLGIGEEVQGQITVLNQTYYLSQINVVFFRNGRLTYKNDGHHFSGLDGKVLGSLNHFLNNEVRESMSFLHNQLLRNKKCYGYYEYSLFNKLDVLVLAKEVGLQIPKTYIIDSKDTLNRITSDGGHWITKSIKDIFTSTDEDNFYYTRTKRIAPKTVNRLSEKSLPFLVQKEVIKRYELRVFFFKEHYFASAIFSQCFEETEVDYREFNNPLRIVPYELPKVILQQLKLLSNKMKLSTGSYDLMVASSGEYVFLEVNPEGQFGFISEACNYKIEQAIAEILMNCNEEK